MDDKPVFSKLGEPIAIGTMMVKNRMVVPAMGTGFATPDGLITQQALDYYEARAKPWLRKGAWYGRGHSDEQEGVVAA